MLRWMDRPDDAPRPGPSGRAAAAVFLELLQVEDRPMDVRALKQRLIERGEPAAAVDAAWRRAQPVLRRHPGVAFDDARGAYRYQGAGSRVPTLDPAEALELLLPARMTGRKAALAGTVRAALAERDDLEARLRAGFAGGRELRAGQERQIRLDVVRVLVDVVSEVDELAAAGAEPAIAAERVRGLAQAFGLRAIGRAGERTTFAPARHAPIGTWPSDDSPVLVLRPGYSWHDGAEVVLVAKAQVALVEGVPNVHIGGSGDGDRGH
jgi:hypothetical protein